jgi:hypothetical protein
VQDAYSLRCAPQVHGATRDLLDYVDYTVSVEINAATDNPSSSVEDDLLVSNGNFHGQPVAFALDALAIGVAELASISERRVERLVNPNLSDGLPPFLTVDGGLNSGFMIPQYVAASLVSENKVLAHPGERRLDPDERRAGGPRLDGERRRPERRGRCLRTPSGRSRSSFSPGRRGSSSWRRSSRDAAWSPPTGRPVAVSASDRDDRPLGGEIDRS